MKSKYLFIFILLSASFYHTRAQVRFYNQFKSIPFIKGNSSSFDVLVGAKIDPNKEIVLGLGLAGSYNTKSAIEDISFNQKSANVSFNYYTSRRFYLNFLVNFNLLKNSLDDIQNNSVKDAAGKIFNRFFVNYEITGNYIFLRRLHLSAGMGIADFASVVRSTSSTILAGDIPSLDFIGTVSLKLYLFQIKY